MGGIGKIKWSTVADSLPGRVGKQCRERWFNHLDPSVKKGEWTPEEDDIVFEMQKQRGNKWSEIARLVPGRSENAVKNRWNSSARKRWYESRSEEDPGTPRSNSSKPNTPKLSKKSGSLKAHTSSSSSLKKETTPAQPTHHNGHHNGHHHRATTPPSVPYGAATSATSSTSATVDKKGSPLQQMRFIIDLPYDIREYIFTLYCSQLHERMCHRQTWNQIHMELEILVLLREIIGTLFDRL